MKNQKKKKKKKNGIKINCKRRLKGKRNTPNQKWRMFVVVTPATQFVAMAMTFKKTFFFSSSCYISISIFFFNKNFSLKRTYDVYQLRTSIKNNPRGG